MKKKQLKRVNLGCGNRKIVDFINVDIDPECKPDIIADLNKKFPFKDNSIDFVYCSHVIEHIDDIFQFMFEIWRVCKHDAEVHIIAPNFIDWLTSINPAHVRFIRAGYFQIWDPTYIARFNSPTNNYKFMTKGAEFITFQEGTIKELRELFFRLHVVKKNDKRMGK